MSFAWNERAEKHFRIVRFDHSSWNLRDLVWKFHWRHASFCSRKDEEALVALQAVQPWREGLIYFLLVSLSMDDSEEQWSNAVGPSYAGNVRFPLATTREKKGALFFAVSNVSGWPSARIRKKMIFSLVSRRKTHFPRIREIRILSLSLIRKCSDGVNEFSFTRDLRFTQWKMFHKTF